ncbi:hypothetical protein O181_067677 [Austropuccinia psidii MF-1]|uniref:PQ-loop repeat-containing protein 1 n=1 Tax=Austropuccinia psidii MF-1 TaxID=1389203 RepID=A0A9Q3EXV0_9BASI|nr:hypothetical protein [Austropuccinia psidii MF-1]
MNWVMAISSVGMAIGPPLVYLDQYISISRNKNSQGFSHLICLVLLAANITRLFYWLGERFDTALVIQSILMIITQFGLLEICLRYNQTSHQISVDNSQFDHPRTTSRQPTNIVLPIGHIERSIPQAQNSISSPAFSFGNVMNQKIDFYIDAFALLIVSEVLLFVILQRFHWFIQLIGFVAVGLESTLPLPQLITNYRRKSLAGFSPLVLLGWLFGDGFKSIYLVLIVPHANPIQFKICAFFQLFIDILILFQALIYRRKTHSDLLQLDNNYDDQERNDDILINDNNL